METRILINVDSVDIEILIKELQMYLGPCCEETVGIHASANACYPSHSSPSPHSQKSR